MVRFHSVVNIEDLPTAGNDGTRPEAASGALTMSVVDNTDSTQVITEKAVEIEVFSFPDSIAVAAGDGAAHFFVPSFMNGMNLVRVFAAQKVAGTTGTLDIQIHNVTAGVDLLLIKLTIDSGERTSATAATPAVIDPANDDVATDDELRVDIDNVQTTPGTSLMLVMEFQRPAA